MSQGFELKYATRYHNESFETIEFSESGSENTKFSVIIGINGTGKSRLLGGMIRKILGVQTDRGDYSEQLPYIPEISYKIKENDYTISTMDEENIYSKNGHSCFRYEMEFPRRIIALTMSPLDKFPLAKSIFQPNLPARRGPKNYAYVGLRYGSGMTGVSHLLYSALETMSENVDSDERYKGNLAKVIEFLGYAPRFKFIYTSRYGKSLIEKAYNDEEFDAELERLSALKSPMYRRMSRYIEKQYISKAELQLALMYANDLSENSDDVEVDALFNDLGFNFADPKLAQHITLLRRVGLLRLKSVLVNHRSGSRVDLLDASSGELSILVSFFGLAANIQDGSMILIDEPELSLHPEWQRRYLYLLDKAFSNYRGCHFILATHSPIIISDFPRNISHLISLDNEAVSDIDELSGQSSDYILANAFGILSQKNYYLRDLVAKCLKHASVGDFKSEDYISSFNKLRQLRSLMHEDNVFVGVIDALEKGAASYAEHIK